MPPEVDPNNPPQPPAPNSPEARNPDGSLKTTPTIDPPKEPEAKPPEGEKPPEAKAPEGAPEKYEAFTMPEGFKIDEKQFGEVSELFKKHGLSQPAAQELVDYYTKNSLEIINKMKSDAEEVDKTYNDMRADFRAKLDADPTIGPRKAEIKTNLGRALDALGDAALATDFKAAMDLTGAGDHPAFVKVIDKLVQKFLEGREPPRGNPAPVPRPGAGAKSAAEAIFPHLAGPQRG